MNKLAGSMAKTALPENKIQPHEKVSQKFTHFACYYYKMKVVKDN
jgi:hypothetical protein